MRLVRLRHQMLIAMGIAGPGCWTGTTPTAAPPPPPPAPKVAMQFEPESCPRDSIPETVCGERRETARACGAKASNLATVEESKLWLTEEDSDEPSVTYRDFEFDREATRVFREPIDENKSSYCCYSRCTAMTVGIPDPAQTATLRGSTCLPVPPNGTSRPAKEDAACAAGVMLEGAIRPYTSTEEGSCCYAVPTRKIILQPIPGRALRIDGVPRVAEVARVASDHAWTASIEPSLALAPELRARLAVAWLEIARLEHASVAAFAALAVRLLAAGAPPALIAAAHRAALDEVRHAQLAFTLASAYRGEQVGPGCFEAARRAPVDGDLRALAIETFVDGCIGETAAAHGAEVVAALAGDPVVAAALAEIAEDETRHAALAWSIVAWCVRRGAVTVAELRAIVAGIPGASPWETERDELARHGVLGDEAALALRDDVLRDVVEPCLVALAA